MHYPKHLAVIPDGNRTWAKEQWVPQMEWHLEWFANSVTLAKYVFSQTPISSFTLRWLSTENLKERSEQELTYLFALYKKIYEDLADFCREHEVNFRWMGSLTWLPSDLVDFFQTKQREFVFDSWKYVNLAVNYGGQDEIVRGIHACAADGCDMQTVSAATFSGYLDFGKQAPVDLVVRTKGKMAHRLSGFLLWRIGYAELYFSPEYFPAFDVPKLEEALQWFDSVVAFRNFGK